MTHAAIALPATPLAIAGPTAEDREQLAVLNFLATYTGTTRQSYQESLKAFYEWCRQNNLTMLGITRAQLEIYLRYLEQYVSTHTGRPLAQATIANRFGAVFNFYAYAEADEIIEKNPAKNVRRPKIDRDAQKRSYLNVGDFHLFCREGSRAGGQTRAITMLFGTIGMRVSEVCSLNVADVHAETGEAYIEYVRKGSKITRPNLPVPTLLALQFVVEQRIREGRGDGPLFLTQRGTRIDRKYVQRMIDELCASAGITTKITPHSLRRSFITTAARLGAPMADLQRAAYHTDPRTTLLYVQIKDGGTTTRQMITDFLAAG